MGSRCLFRGVVALAMLTGLVAFPGPARARGIESRKWPDNWGSPFNTEFFDVMTNYGALSRGCANADLSQPYTYYLESGETQHLGVDLAWGAGLPVYAIADGMVRSAGEPWGPGGREVLVIQHTAFPDEKFAAAYGHIYIEVNPGTGQKWRRSDVVHRGDVIGTIAAAEDGPHLHFGIAPGTASDVAEVSQNHCVADGLGNVDPILYLAARAPTTDSNSVLGGGYLHTPDGTIYRLVGGAPIPLSDCGPLNGCGPLRPVASIHGYRTDIADGTFVRVADGESAGLVARAVGGTLIPLSSCDAIGGCPNWVDVNGSSYTAYLNANPTIDDGALLRVVDSDRAGRVGHGVGGTLLEVTSCAPFNGCAGSVEINEASYDAYVNAHRTIENETFVRVVDGDKTGLVARAVGGMLIDVSACEPLAGCPDIVSINGASYADYVDDHKTMADGTFVKIADGDTPGRVARAVGETLVVLSDCDAFDGCPDSVGINAASYRSYLEAHPTIKHGAFITVTDGESAGLVALAVGGSLIALTGCDGLEGCPNGVKIDSESYYRYLGDHQTIAEGAFVRVVDGDLAGRRARIVGGTLIELTSCQEFSGCPDTVAINSGSYSSYLNEHPAIEDGAFVLVADGDLEGQIGRAVAGTLVEVENCDDLGGCLNPVGINESSWVAYLKAHQDLENETTIEARPSGQRWRVDDGCLTKGDPGVSDVAIPDAAVEDLKDQLESCRASRFGLSQAPIVLLPVVVVGVVVGAAFFFLRRRRTVRPAGSTPAVYKRGGAGAAAARAASITVVLNPEGTPPTGVDGEGEPVYWFTTPAN